MQVIFNVNSSFYFNIVDYASEVIQQDDDIQNNASTPWLCPQGTIETSRSKNQETENASLLEQVKKYKSSMYPI